MYIINYNNSYSGAFLSVFAYKVGAGQTSAGRLVLVFHYVYLPSELLHKIACESKVNGHAALRAALLRMKARHVYAPFRSVLDVWHWHADAVRSFHSDRYINVSVCFIARINFLAEGDCKMFCTNCGSKLPDDALFCPDCGEKVLTEDVGNEDIGNWEESNEHSGILNKENIQENDSENTNEDFEIPDMERTVILKNSADLESSENPQDEENPSFSDNMIAHSAAGETQILDNLNMGNGIPGSETVIIGNDGAEAGQAPLPREDTQTVFNDIQESLAHPDIDFEHSPGGPGSESTVHMYTGPAPENINQGMDNSQGYIPPNGGAGGSGVPPFVPENGSIGGKNGDDGSGQKPKQQKKLALILGISACAVVGIAVIVAVVLMFSSMGKQKKEYENQVNQGEEYMSDSEYDEAIEAFRKAIDIDEDSEDAYVGLADAYIKNKEYRKAAEVLQQGSKATGGKKRIEEKKDELYDIAPELKDEFEDNSQHANGNTNKPSNPSQPSNAQTESPENTGNNENENPPAVPDTVTPDTAAPETTVPQTNPEETTTPEKTDEKETETSAPETKETEAIVPDKSDGDGQKPADEEGNDGQGDVVTVGSIQYQFKEYYHETKLPNGELGAYTQVKYPYFTGDSQIAKALNGYMESVVKSFGTSEEAVKGYTGEEDIDFPLYDKVVYEVTYGEHGFVSMKYTYESTHSTAKLTGLIFNGSDGSQLSWNNVFSGGEEALRALIKTYYKPEDNNGMPVEELLKRLSSNWNNCYLDVDGMTFIASGDESIAVLIPFSEKDYFKFLNDESQGPAQSESAGESQSTQESETVQESESSQTDQAPQIKSVSWVVEPVLEFDDVPVIMDDVLRYGTVVSNHFPMAVYKKDGKLGFVKYDGTVMTDPIYNMVYGCGADSNAEYTLYASAAGSDLWSAAAVDTASGQASGAVHMGHGGDDGIVVYSRSDGKLYILSSMGFYETSSSSGNVLPAAVIDDINTADFSTVASGEGIAYGLYLPDGKFDESHLYDHIYLLSDGRMVAWSGGKYGVIDEAGNVVIPFEYEGASYLDFDAVAGNPGEAATCEKEPYPYSEGYIALKKDGVWGYFDTNGNCVTEMVFEEARPFSQGKAFVKINGKWGVIEIAPQG